MNVQLGSHITLKMSGGEKKKGDLKNTLAIASPTFPCTTKHPKCHGKCQFLF